MTTNTEQLGIAVCGCGYWGINYVRVFSELPETRVVAVCDQRPERLQEVERRFPGLSYVTDIDELLALDGIDAVVVCTQAAGHFGVTQRSLESGRHVLVEKPITTIADEAQQLIATAQAHHRTLMVGHTFLYNAGVRKVKDYLDDDEAMGQIYYLYARRTNLGPIRRDVNALWDLAPHDISIFNYWLDAVPDWVSAVGADLLQNSLADVGFVSLGYPNNRICHIHVSWADPNKVREVVVVSSNKRIVFSDTSMQEQVRIFEKGVTPVEPAADSYGEYRLLMRDGDIISPRIQVSEPLKNQCKHFVDCVTTGQQPLTDGAAGMAVVQVMEAIDRSIQHQGAPMPVGTPR